MYESHLRAGFRFLPSVFTHKIFKPRNESSSGNVIYFVNFSACKNKDNISSTRNEYSSSTSKCLGSTHQERNYDLLY